jgi:uncharacterized hydrophobic protein (TIGR00341 family)
MPFRWIEVLADESQAEAIRETAEEAGVSEIVVSRVQPGGQVSVRLLAGEIDRQDLLDRLQDRLEGEGHWRLILTRTEAVTPHTEAEREREQTARARRRRAALATSREEIYENVVTGAALTGDYLLLIALSSVVATIGLVEDTLAVVIGAMVIAPQLGPALAIAFGAAVGDRRLVIRALVTMLAGLACAVAFALLVSPFFEADPGSGELAKRTAVGFAEVGLALASGAAAALSITSGLSSALVGVMVAAALVPPASAIGICLTAGAPGAAAGAALLLGVNLVSVTLAAILTFLGKSVRPRSWHQYADRVQSLRVTLAILGGALLIMVGLIAISRAPWS